MPEHDLDAPALYERLDSEGLGGRIAALPAQIEEAWAAARSFALPAEYAGATNVVVLGMGGSGIGGAMLRALSLDLGARTPVHLVAGYTLPAWAGAETLVIASSNSGNTEEVVAAFGEAIARRVMCVAVTAGGKVAEMARASGVPLLAVRWDAEPRAALGWSFAAPLALCSALGLAPGPDLDADCAAAVEEMRAAAAAIECGVPESRNAAKQLARRLAGRLPVFVGAGALAPVAYRWRTQVNENADSWAIADELPELNHNAQAGYGLPQRVVSLLHAVLLRHASAHPRVALRFDATADEMRRCGVSAEIVEAPGGTLLAQVLRAVHLGDYVSYYLALLNGVHPSRTPPLTAIKERLAASR